MPTPHSAGMTYIPQLTDFHAWSVSVVVHAGQAHDIFINLRYEVVRMAEPGHCALTAQNRCPAIGSLFNIEAVEQAVFEEASVRVLPSPDLSSGH